MNPILLAHQQFQLGRPDRYLYPYYQKDIQNGALTKERAQLLLDCLGIQINMRVPNILTSGYMIGGRDKDGNLIENELTHTRPLRIIFR
jgi:formate C-acetyltransferase